MEEKGKMPTHMFSKVAVKEPGQVRKSSSQVTRMHFSPQQKVDDLLFSCRPQNTGRQRRFTVKIKQIKRSDMVTFLSSVLTITEAKQYPGRSQGLSQGGGSSSQVIWCSAATEKSATTVQSVKQRRAKLQ